MLHECHYCHEFKGIQSFYNDPEDQICFDCYTDMTNNLIKEEMLLNEEELLSNEDELPF